MKNRFLWNFAVKLDYQKPRQRQGLGICEPFKAVDWSRLCRWASAGGMGVDRQIPAMPKRVLMALWTEGRLGSLPRRKMRDRRRGWD